MISDKNNEHLVLSPRSVLSDEDEMKRAVQIGTEDLRLTVVAVGTDQPPTEPNGASRDELEQWSGVMSMPVPLATTSRDSETSSMQPQSPSFYQHRHLARDTPNSPLLHDNIITNDNDDDRSISRSLTPANGSPLLIRLNSVSTTSTKSNNSLLNTGTDEPEPSLANR